uniref:Integrase catalytic domain-containing protein n=1 Tax=Stegastes partitus TaxID=144197 RepID=A0A3B5B3G0_9TELE
RDGTASHHVSNLIRHMKSIFARHGIPQIVYSDNGPCYSCRDPLYAQSNAQVSSSDPYLPLEYGMSPAELLMERRLRTTIPYIAQKKHNKMGQKQRQLQMRQKVNYDKSSKSLIPLQTHDTVRLEDSNNWTKKATVLEEVSPRSYTVKTEDGQVLRRNRRSLEEDPVCTSASAEPLPVSDEHSADQTPSTPVLRRSTRTVKAPDRLIL